MNHLLNLTKLALLSQLLLPFLPLIAWQGKYEESKVIIFLAIGATLALNLVFNIYKNKLKFNLQDYLYLSWLGVLLSSSLQGVYPFESIIGTSYRKQGVLFFLMLWVVMSSLKTLKNKNKLFQKIFSTAVYLEALLVIFQFLVYHTRPLGTLGKPNAVGGFLAISSVAINLNPYNFSLIGSAIFLTNSRAAILSFIAILIGKNHKKLIHFNKKLLLIGFLICLVSIISFAYAAQKRPYSKYENRALIWDMGIEMFLKKPILGYGAESGQEIYEIAFEKRQMPLDGIIFDRSHNLAIDLLHWSGIIGLALFSAWFASEIYKLHKNKNVIKIFGVFSWLIFAFFQPLSVVHWLVLGMLLSF